MSPDQYCQQKASKSGSSFYYSFLFLSPERRRAITAFYAFCRELDDTVDESTDPALARTQLGWWKTEIQALFSGRPTHPITRALAPHILVYGLEQKFLNAIIDGMEMDLNQTRYLDFQGLSTYCWHVAGAVGILAARIFGAQDGVISPCTLQYAEKLGLAFQLTNIIRDVGADARLGRIYLPIDELQKFQVTAADILNARYSENFVHLMQFQMERAQATYEEAFALLPHSERKTQRPGLIMAAIYRTLLNEIARDQFQVLTQRIALTPLRKFWIAWKTYFHG